MKNEIILTLIGFILLCFLSFIAGMSQEQKNTERELSHYPLTVINYTPEDNVIERRQFGWTVGTVLAKDANGRIYKAGPLTPKDEIFGTVISRELIK